MTRARITGITDVDYLKRLVRDEIAMHGPAVDLNHIDVSGLDRFNGVFEDTPFVGNISQWNVSNAVVAIAMFKNCPFNGDISQWKPKNLVIADSMFEGSAFNGDISNWTFKKLQQTTKMFAHSAFNGNLSRWNMGKVEFAAAMFQGSSFNGDISNWRVNAIRQMRFFFADSAFNGDISQWNILSASHGDMHGMFKNSAFTGNLSNWKVHVHASGIHRMFDEGFKGIPPMPEQDPTRNFYLVLFGTAKKLSDYLKATAFNSAHLDICLVASTKPVGVGTDDYQWFKGLAQTAQGVGMSVSELRSYAMATHANRSLCAEPLDATPIDIGLLIEAL